MKNELFFHHCIKLNSENMLAFLVIDEVHIISILGKVFHEYDAVNYRQHFPKLPIMMMTTTAGTAVKHDILEKLKLNDAVMVERFSFPENLEISMNYLAVKDSCTDKVVDLMNQALFFVERKKQQVKFAIN